MRRYALALALFACGATKQPPVVSVEALPAPPPPEPKAPPPPKDEIEGVYVLDMDETVEALSRGADKLPKEQQQIRKLAAEIFKRLDMTLVLAPDGTATMRTRMPDLMDPDAGSKTEEQTATWRRDGDDVIITSKGKDSRCERRADRLSCAEKPEEGAVVFKRQR